MPVVMIGIGSNVDAQANIRDAVAALRTRFPTLRCSPVYRTPAVGFTGDDFFNLVVSIDTELAIPEISAELRQLETHHGRHRGEAKFAPRTLDLDLLTYGDTVGTYGKLVFPRSDILEYAFVLKPLADLDPNARHPTAQRTYRELWLAHQVNCQEPLTLIPNFLAETLSSAAQHADKGNL